MHRREFLALTAASLAASVVPAAAQFRPTRPIEVVAHNGPGSGPDAFARALISSIEQENLSPVRFQVSNRVGGGGATAMSYMVEKRGDSHVIGVFTSVWLTNPLIQAELQATVKGMTPLSRLVIEPALVVVRGDSPHRTLRDFVEAAKANPGKLRQSGGSPAARDALVRQLLLRNTGARWSFISFPSGGERVSALLGGHADMMVIEPPEAGEHIRAGTMRAIALVGDARLPEYADIPTLKEAGFHITNVPQARGLLAPPDIPAEAVAFYEDLLRKVSDSASWRKIVQDNRWQPAYLGSAATGVFFDEYMNQLREILRESGQKVVR